MSAFLRLLDRVNRTVGYFSGSYRRLLLPVILVACTGGAAVAELLWDNNIQIDFQSGIAMSPPTHPDIRLAEDIVVPAGGWVITGFGYKAADDDDFQPSGMSEVFVYADQDGEPGAFVVRQTRANVRTFSGDVIFGRDVYEYRVVGLAIVLPQGTYWIGARDPGGNGEGSQWWATSDGGPDGGCLPDHPSGTCMVYYVSEDGGDTWGAPVPFEHLALEVTGVLGLGDIEGDGDVDLFDFAGFDSCVTGPAGVSTLSCRMFDADEDGDVDWADFRFFQLVFVGSG